MNDVREIVTNAVVCKGRKIIRLTETVEPNNSVFSILGCWVINNEFDANLEDNKVNLNGSFDVNIWYAYNNNQATDIAKRRVNYGTIIKTRQIVKEVNNDCREVIIRILQQPTCTNARIVSSGIEVDIILEVVAEIIGETKIMVTVFAPMDNCEALDDDFENEINENFINEN